MTSKKPKSKPRSSSQKWKNVTIVAAAIAGLFTLLSIVLQFFLPRVFTPEPPRVLTPDPPRTYRAILSKLSVERNVQLATYLARSSISSEEYTTDELNQNGYIVHFQVEIEGFEGRKCTARWSVYDAGAMSTINLPEPWDEIQDPIDFFPEQRVDTAAEFFWVPVLEKDGKFFVRVELYDDKGLRLTYADTEPVPNKSR